MADMGGGPDETPETAEDAMAEQAFVDQAVAERAAALATEATEAEHPPDRRRIRDSLVRAAQSSARASGRGVRAARRGMGFGLGWMTGQAIAMAPRLKVRNQAALQGQFPGMSSEDIADALIEGASRASAAVGGAIGAWAALPVLPAFPVELATETLALVGIEVKLVAELHEAYGVPATGNVVERMTAYLAAWANRRGIALAPGGLILAAGSPIARKLRRRIAARAGRSVFALGPLLTGAAAGALLNRRETRRLGQEIRADLRRGVHPR